MSLNVLLSAVVQRSSAQAQTESRGIVDHGVTDATKKKRKRAKAEEAQTLVAAQAFRKSTPGLEDEEEKQKKRRAQIAEASRRSRARRKKEFQDFKEENDQLWSQNMLLRKILQDLGVDTPPPLISKVEREQTAGTVSNSNDISSDDEDEDGNPSSFSPGTSPASSPLSQDAGLQMNSNNIANGAVSQHPQIHWVVLGQSPDSVDNPSEQLSGQSGFQDFGQFFERRLSWYFTQLKSDTIRSFASQLPYEEKQRIAGLQVRLAFGENLSPTLTPNVNISSSAARITSATQAEQVVDHDKNVRL